MYRAISPFRAAILLLLGATAVPLHAQTDPDEFSIAGAIGGGIGQVTGTVTDIDGNVYRTVRIGSQVWMTEELRVTRFRNGEPIPHIRDDDAWGRRDAAGYSAYAHNLNRVSRYGLFYNWYAAFDARGLCPAGWHVPTEAEWMRLIDHLGGSSVAGPKMKDTAPGRWMPLYVPRGVRPPPSPTNESGFSARAAGYRWNTGRFARGGRVARYWTSSESYPDLAFFVALRYDTSEVQIFGPLYHHRFGHSVRCIRD